MPRPPRQLEFEVMASGRLRRPKVVPIEKKPADSASAGQFGGRKPRLVSVSPTKEDKHGSAE